MAVDVVGQLNGQEFAVGIVVRGRQLNTKRISKSVVFLLCMPCFGGCVETPDNRQV